MVFVYENLILKATVLFGKYRKFIYPFKNILKEKMEAKILGN